MIPILWVLLLAAPPGPALTVSLTEAGPARVGVEVPWFAGWTPDEQILNRTKVLQGQPPGTKAIVVVVFATWCAPCAAGLEVLVRARPALDAAGVRLLLVAFREEADTVRPWLAARGFDAKTPLILDRFGRAAAAFGAEQGGRATLPRTVVLAPDGTVRALLGAEGPDYLERILALAR